MRSAARCFSVLLVATLHSASSATIGIDYDRPRSGPLCVAAAVGDVLKFSWKELHNLNELTDRNSYDQCVFSGAQKLADAKPNAGVIVELPTAGTRYFACSKICASNGHKVKVCVLENGGSGCDCPEGTQVQPPTQKQVNNGDVVSGALVLSSSSAVYAGSILFSFVVSRALM